MNWLVEKIERCGPMTANDLMQCTSVRRRFSCSACLHAALGVLTAEQKIQRTISKPKTGRPTQIYSVKGST